MPVPHLSSLDGLIANIEAERGRTIHLIPAPDQLLAGPSSCGLWIRQDSSGILDASYLGAYRVPDRTVPGVTGPAYCADPELDGPETAGQYGTTKEYSAWTSQASGKKASPGNVARAAVDAAVYSYLEAGTTCALPHGKRALEGLAYPNGSADAKKWAIYDMNEAVMFAGPVSGAWQERGGLPHVLAAPQ